MIYFWANKSPPLEPIHVHVSKGKPSRDATKVWITSAGKTLLCHNNSHIKERTLYAIMLTIEARCDDIRREWQTRFGDISYYC